MLERRDLVVLPISKVSQWIHSSPRQRVLYMSFALGGVGMCSASTRVDISLVSLFVRRKTATMEHVLSDRSLNADVCRNTLADFLTAASSLRERVLIIRKICRSTATKRCWLHVRAGSNSASMSRPGLPGLYLRLSRLTPGRGFWMRSSHVIPARITIPWYPGWMFLLCRGQFDLYCPDTEKALSTKKHPLAFVDRMIPFVSFHDRFLVILTFFWC